MLFAILLFSLVLLVIFRPRVAFVLFRPAWLFAPELIGATTFVMIFLFLHGRSPIAPTPGMFSFLLICSAVVGAAIGRKAFILYISPYLPKDLTRRRENGRD